MFSSLYWELAYKCLTFCFATVTELAKDLKIVACNFFQNSKQKMNLSTSDLHFRNESTTSTPMTTNTRKWKSRLAEDLTGLTFSIGSEANQVKVLALSLLQHGLLGTFQTDRKPTKAGRTMTPIEMRTALWDFWHDKNTVSTLTSCPARLKLTDKPKI